VVSARNVHLVFVTKYRRGVLTGEHLDTLRVHLLVAYPGPTSRSPGW